MTDVSRQPPRVLSIDPTTRGFGYAVLEGPGELVDWGVKATRTDKNARGVAKIVALIEAYRPEVIVVEDHAGRGAHRCYRVRRLLDAVARCAKRLHTRVRWFAPARIREVFQTFGATTKEEIARVIAGQLPELAEHLPRHRKPWMSEDYRMAIFDAVSLGLTFFFTRRA